MRAMATMAIEARLARVDILDPNFEKNNKLKPKQVAELKRLKGIYDKLPKEVPKTYTKLCVTTLMLCMWSTKQKY